MKRKIGNEVYCGECPFFKNENIDGYGCCEISKMEEFCGDLCYFITNGMHVQETLRLLHYCQKWRRGANIKMPPPTLFGLAIDNAMRYIRAMRKINKLKK